MKFSPTIELGHLLQAVVAAATLTGWGLWGYASIEAQLATTRAEVSLLTQRIDQDEKLSTQDREDQRARDARVTSALDKIVDRLADLRTLVAAKTDGARR